jgi:hypothetical protein
MKVGIYISGLGQSFVNETVEKYAQRLKNEMSFDTNGVEYEIKTEKVVYTNERESTVVSIYENNGEAERLVYKFYDFKYHEILTEKFNSYSLVLKNFWLLVLVIRKVPLVLKRLFRPNSYTHPYQMLYFFIIFFIIAFTIILMLPATLSVITNFLGEAHTNDFIIGLKDFFGIKQIPLVSVGFLDGLSKVIVGFTALVLLILPKANVLIPNLATEFVCANDYIHHGMQKQLLLGNLEHLVEYIVENEDDCKIHFHTYSFGSIIALDYIYPFGNKLSANAEFFAEALITIGTPFEFVKSYYPNYYQNRLTTYGDKLHWLNVYSIADALATNFRKDSEQGEAEFGIDKQAKKPFNINYEVSAINKYSLANFIMLHSIKVHGMYWDAKTNGQSCLRLIYTEMKQQCLI